MQLFIQKKFMGLAFFVFALSTFFVHFCSFAPDERGESGVEGSNEKIFLGSVALLGLGVSLCVNGCDPVAAVRGTVTAGMAAELALREFEKVKDWVVGEALSVAY